MTGIPIKNLPEHTQRAIANALAKDKRKEIKTAASWLRKVEDMKTLLHAMEHNEPEVQLTIGKFKIVPRYRQGTSGYFVSPTDGRFVPCGFFTTLSLEMEIAINED